MPTEGEILEGLGIIESAVEYAFNAISHLTIKKPRAATKEELIQTKKYNLKSTLLYEYNLFDEDPNVRIAAILSFIRDLRAAADPSTDLTAPDNQRTLIQIFRSNSAQRLADTAPSDALNTKEDLLAYYKEFIADAIFKSIYGHYPADRANTIHNITKDDKIERLTKVQLESIYTKLGISPEKELFSTADLDALEACFHASNRKSIMEIMGDITPSALGIAPRRTVDAATNTASITSCLFGALSFAASHTYLDYAAPRGVDALGTTISNGTISPIVGAAIGIAYYSFSAPTPQTMQYNTANREFVSLSGYEETVALHEGRDKAGAEAQQFRSAAEPGTGTQPWTSFVESQSNGAATTEHVVSVQRR